MCEPALIIIGHGLEDKLTSQLDRNFTLQIGNYNRKKKETTLDLTLFYSCRKNAK